MRKFWIALFALVPPLAVGFFLWARGVEGLWFPPNASETGSDIDFLFWVIFAITGITFLGVEIVFAWFLWKYGGREEGGKGVFTHGNHKLETIWTIIPAGILVFLAIFQYGTWEEAKFYSQAPDSPVHARVLGGQFEWRIRYPGEDGVIWSPDDVEQVNELHVWKNQPVKILLESRDVIHSFFIPQMRVKQDAMPGMKQWVWFTPVESGEFEIACAELCGWGHYKMRARLVVHETEQDFQDWMARATAAQFADTEEAAEEQ